MLDYDYYVSRLIHPVYISNCKANLLTNEDEMHNEIVDKFSRHLEYFSTTFNDAGEFFVHGNE